MDTRQQSAIIVCNVFEDWIHFATLGGHGIYTFGTAGRGVHSEDRGPSCRAAVAPRVTVEVGRWGADDDTLKKAARNLSKAQD
jgi:hypothetical protein